MTDRIIIDRFKLLLSKFHYSSDIAVKTISDIKNIPFTTKETLKDFPLDGSRVFPTHWYFASGTTKDVFPLCTSRAAETGIFRRAEKAFRLAGIKKNDSIINVAGYGFTNGALIFHHGIQRIGASVLSCGPITNKTRKPVLDFIEKFRPSGIIGMHHCVYELLSARNKKSDFIRTVISGGSILTDKIRESIGGFIGEHLYNMYGCNEIGIIAIQDNPREKRWLRLIEDDCYFEILKDNKETCDHGKGMLVITYFLNYSLPIIRFILGDYVEIIKKDGVRYVEILGRADRRFNFNNEVVSVNMLITTVTDILGHNQFNIFIENDPVSLRDILTIKLYKKDSLKANPIEILFTRNLNIRPKIKISAGALLKTPGNNKYANFIDKRALRLKHKNLLY